MISLLVRFLYMSLSLSLFISLSLILKLSRFFGIGPKTNVVPTTWHLGFRKPKFNFFFEKVQIKNKRNETKQKMVSCVRFCEVKNYKE